MPAVRLPSALTTTLVEVVQGGEPDDHGVDLSRWRSPVRPSLSGPPCACAALALMSELWDSLEAHALFTPGAGLWLRTVDPDRYPALPAGSRVVTTRTVLLGVA
ncbi:hypothetical protein [Marinitenerispora sediminis]|uniref:Uncharacterized protein n=1 Tax=Marinitenerispora sediminis TaxID=1931232 RepID=A0A368T7D6_9ACTN|nr:hypothetical protein [Marinitenerispora sediminis]RCV51157.1 hypothetical protein DEF28_16120 [Marinitenerispora sediminis]RCV57062.1 hypothetical protein DEF23_11455 [Marinitenerispora sediminis]RCV59951.1 hypothetical protein DEF24_08360 [Marinitenerispora sediminis]